MPMLIEPLSYITIYYPIRHVEIKTKQSNHLKKENICNQNLIKHHLINDLISNYF